jgi:hypothetical protein
MNRTLTSPPSFVGGDERAEQCSALRTPAGSGVQCVNLEFGEFSPWPLPFRRGEGEESVLRQFVKVPVFIGN